MLKRRGIDPSFLGAYDEPGRYYHDWSHIEDVLSLMGVDVDADVDLEKVLAAVFHDAVYVPGEPDNEELSARLFDRTVTSALSAEAHARVRDAITDTKDHVVRNGNLVSDALCAADMYPLRHRDIARLVADERNIMREFQRFPYAKYREGRLAFLRGLVEQYPTLGQLIAVIEHRRVRVAVLVHGARVAVTGELIARLERTFDKVVLASYGPWNGRGWAVPAEWLHYERVHWNFIEDLKRHADPEYCTYVIAVNDEREKEAMELHDMLLKDGRCPVLTVPEHLASRRFSDDEAALLI